MGMDCIAYLVFGINFNEDENDYGESPLESILGEDEEFDDFICDEMGLPSWEESEKVEDYHSKREKVIAEYPVELFMHGHMDYTRYALIIPGAKTTAYYGENIDLNELMTKVTPEKIQRLKDWCEEFNIPYSEPQWILCSYYG